MHSLRIQECAVSPHPPPPRAYVTAREGPLVTQPSSFEYDKSWDDISTVVGRLLKT